MTMPKWHEIMRPVLVVLEEDCGLVTAKEMYDRTIAFFDLTEGEREERLNSGEKRYHNRMRWAITDLGKAGLLEHGERRGTYRITKEGAAFLACHASAFGTKELMEECPKFYEWKTGYQEKTKRSARSVPRGT